MTKRHWHLGRKGTRLGLLVLAAACAGARPVEAPVPGPAARVVPGIEVLVGDSIHLVRGRAVGLVLNHAAVDAAGISDIDRLGSAGIRLVALFTPEHGFRANAAPGETVASTTDSATGLPIYSLYGAERGPPDSVLAGIDLMLVDLPDVGARYYTYLGTTIEVMRAAARLKRRVLILDRPNPIGGMVQGNVLDPAYRSFVGSLAMPMRHGLTLGELARLANQELGIGADLGVVPARGWSRSLTQYDTKLPFIPPSPNLRDLEGLFHYPGTCLFEGTALSVGRGTEAPFRQIGAPWLDVPRVLALLARDRLAGVRFEETRFTPRAPADGKHPGVEVRGIRLVMTDPNRYDPTITAVALLVAVNRAQPDRIGFRTGAFDRLAGGRVLREQILAGNSAEQITRGWVAARELWERNRSAALVYR